MGMEAFWRLGAGRGGVEGWGPAPPPTVKACASFPSHPLSPARPSALLPKFLVTSPFSSGGSDGKESAGKAGDVDLIPGSGRSPEGGHGHPLQYSCLENPMV